MFHFVLRKSKASEQMAKASEKMKEAKSGVSNFITMMVSRDFFFFCEGSFFFLSKAAPDPPAAHSQELGIFYVTDRVLGMGFPSQDSANFWNRFEKLPLG